MNRPLRKPLAGLAALALTMVGISTIATQVNAASHSDAPLIKLDPQANLTDVYAFIRNRTLPGRGTEKVLNVLVNVRPFCNPGDGVIYDKFSDDARYSIHITHPTTGETLVRYDFMFSGPSAGLKNGNTILSYGLGTQVGALEDNDSLRRNYTQTYRVFKTVGNGAAVEITGGPRITPPPNVGLNTTPFYNDTDGFAVSGAASRAELDVYTRDGIFDLSTGETIFAGPRDDSFFADTAGIFDLLDSRILDNNGTLADGLGQDGNGVDDFDGFNVLTFSIQIPVSDLPVNNFTPVLAGLPVGKSGDTNIFLGGATQGVGVYASVSRPRITLRNSTGAPTSSGPWVQVNRMGNPLFNEVLVALQDKDNYNRVAPFPGGDAAFATYAQNPEVAGLINFVYGTAFQTTGRADLVGVFIPDVLRVDTTTDPVPVPGEPGFSRLGLLGLDVVSSPNGLRESGWPNGRRHGEDVVDIALSVVASGPGFGLPNDANFPVITLVGDNVHGNDLTYHQVFPYIATPHAGRNHEFGPSTSGGVSE